MPMSRRTAMRVIVGARAVADWHEKHDRPWTEKVPPTNPAFVEKWFLRCKDLVDSYRPDLVYFDNTARCNQGTGNTPEAQALAKKMATAWAAFARTGNPSQHGLAWAPFNPDRCPTMVFDNVCRMADDPESEARKILLT
jgi:alpha-L-fucosidase